MHLDDHDHCANGPETFLAKRLLHSRVAAESPWIVRNFEQTVPQRMISDCGSELLAPSAFKPYPNHSLKAKVRPGDREDRLGKGY